MKSIKIYAFVMIAIASLTFNTYAQDKRPAREKMQQVSMQGTVTEVNAETRDITLMGTNGGLMTVTAGEEVERFNEIAVGDVLKFEYLTYLKAEFRDPTPEELEAPLQMIAEGGKAPEDMDPAGVVGAVVKAVVTIEALNRPNMIATVTGPNGNYVSIPMEDEKLITELHIGEVLILTYAEAIVIALEKVAVKQ